MCHKLRRKLCFIKKKEGKVVIYFRCSFQGRIRGIPGSIPRGTTLGQCACLYARAGLVVHLWWVGNRCESKKKKELII